MNGGGAAAAAATAMLIQRRREEDMLRQAAKKAISAFLFKQPGFQKGAAEGCALVGAHVEDLREQLWPHAVTVPPRTQGFWSRLFNRVSPETETGMERARRRGMDLLQSSVRHAVGHFSPDDDLLVAIAVVDKSWELGTPLNAERWIAGLSEQDCVNLGRQTYIRALAGTYRDIADNADGRNTCKIPVLYSLIDQYADRALKPLAPMDADLARHAFERYSARAADLLQLWGGGGKRPAPTAPDVAPG